MLPGQLVLDAEDYYAIIVDTPRAHNQIPEGSVELFLANGLRVISPSANLRPLGLKLGAAASPPATFHEIVFAAGAHDPKLSRSPPAAAGNP
jgi:hypothetical protein